ncbi:hypothetical protein EHP00_143 [Ecytonucleospora hepatopenaei]|uniref:Uncharacterized protein n=1 Tax=Ecytonucleospora hepatopenaei TaxID=646526 RepID=A0A1W0E5X2_9MICR|nr:hypothetical protein EHP00_143 [Ecytonucleospora hepatopenaei]
MCSFDLWFARKKGNEKISEIVMLKNKVVPFDTIKNATTEYRAGTYVSKNRIHTKPLDQIFSEEVIVCQTANELKTTDFDKERYERFHIADIVANGTFHFFFLTEQKKIEIKQLVGEKELSEDNSNTFDEFLSSDINNHILNIASADISNNGKQSLLISKHSESDREAKIFAVDFSTQSNNNKIEILTFFKDKTPQYVPGVSYFIGLNNGNQRLLFSQSPQPSYPSLHQKGTFVGVGTTHFFLTFLYAGLPLTSFKEHVKNCPASIFPTTITVLTFENNDMLYMCFFTSPHLNLVTIILFIMLLMALGIIIYLTFQERKRQKIKTKNDNIQKFMKMV